MEPLLVSACLLGFACKYDGGSNPLPPEQLARLRARYKLIPVCPETASGLPAPREPSERVPGRVIGRGGQDVTAAFEKGADTALALAERFRCAKALLKERSPSCGSGTVYDGSFTRTLTPGDGVAAEKLRSAGLTLYGESEIEDLLA